MGGTSLKAHAKDGDALHVIKLDGRPDVLQ
jgi:hypothetical protein